MILSFSLFPILYYSSLLCTITTGKDLPARYDV